ncbi:hypothetical protein CU048_13805 [Beijerinckiaceae bacterium]|nr:hypothetical protein CU048_13805 [Beijerinckiaceae bacterium]
MQTSASSRVLGTTHFMAGLMTNGASGRFSRSLPRGAGATPKAPGCTLSGFCSVLFKMLMNGSAQRATHLENALGCRSSTTYPNRYGAGFRPNTARFPKRKLLPRSVKLRRRPDRNGDAAKGAHDERALTPSHRDLPRAASPKHWRHHRYSAPRTRRGNALHRGQIGRRAAAFLEAGAGALAIDFRRREGTRRAGRREREMNALFQTPQVTPPRELYDHQKLAIDLLRESIAAGKRRPMLQLATGSGKTEIAMNIARSAAAKGHRVAFLVPRTVLIEQTVENFRRGGVPDVGVLQGMRGRDSCQKQVVVASEQTLVRRPTQNFGLVIVDEAHMQFDAVKKWFASPEMQNTIVVGLSATPWSRGLGRVYDDLIKPVSMTGLMSIGRLSRFKIFAPPPPELGSVHIDKGEFRNDELSDICNRREIIADVIDTWKKRGEGMPTVCYGVDRKHAQHLHERFIEAGVAAEYLDCDTIQLDRDDMFHRFASGETKILCNVGTIDTGFDADVRCIIDARPTRSRIRHVQSIGRGLRIAEGKDHCIILDHAGNTERLGIVTEIDVPALHDGEGNKNFDTGKIAVEPGIKLCPECRVVVPPAVRACPECGHVFFAITKVAELDGDLVEYGSGAPGDSESKADPSTFIKMLKGYAEERGYQNPDGFAWNKFKEKFGRKPGSWGYVQSAAAVPPDVKTRNWIRSRHIAFSKGSGA